MTADDREPALPGLDAGSAEAASPSALPFRLNLAFEKQRCLVCHGWVAQKDAVAHVRWADNETTIGNEVYGWKCATHA